MPIRFPLIAWLSACLVMSVMWTSVARAADTPSGKIDFNRDIRPILSNACFSCHGPDAEERKGGTDGLRLDTEAGAFADLGGYAVIERGKPDESELLRRILSTDDGERMPPAASGKKLNEREVSIIRQWIAEGAPYANHWSYTKPVRPELPESTADHDWPKTAIDRFLLARLEREGLSPSAEADRATLIRRLSLDLTGLPPTAAEVDEFLNDSSADAYAKLVDRMLEKETFGEHWARTWLDLARYADSAGYADDPPRTIWQFRDYVIRSLNANKPFDQFTIEQIAGDLLPNPTDEQLMGTAFHRNTLTNNEGGTNDEEFRSVAIVDRVNTTMAVWMGTTMACAQCHTHKYDPISQEEYFRFYAIFNNTEDADRRDESPLLQIWTDEQEQQKIAWRNEIEQLKQTLAADTPELRAAQAKWEAEVAASESAAPIGKFVRIEIVDRAEFLSLAEVQVFRGGDNIAIKGKASQSSTDYEGQPALAIDGNTNGDYFAAKSTTHTKNEKNPWWQVELAEAGPVERVVVWNRTDGAVGNRLKGWRVSILDEKQQVIFSQDIADEPAPSRDLAINGLPAEILAIAKTPGADRSAAQTKQIAEYYRSISPEQQAQRERLKSLEKQLADIKPATTVPIMRELAEGRRRKTHVQFRGSYLDLGPEVSEGVPTAFHDLPDGVPANRLALARWLVDRDNPLTARVMVNRFWEQIFGVGIVRTSEEFGSQGDLPTHPELLDWLAVEFMESGWDMKHMLKLLVTSAAYRQTSRVTPELAERDPDNILLARGPRFRMSAEMIRDQALFAAGLLSPKMYGPPVKPPQPSLGLNAAFGSGIDWQTSTGEDRYRRGLYTTWRRSNPYPSMAAFDAPNREVCTLKRDRTNTPLQALVTLNDPVYIEAAQALARKMAEAGSDAPSNVAPNKLEPSVLERRLRVGFQRCLIREPNDDELASLVALYHKTAETMRADMAAANSLATEPLGPLPAGADAADYAALTVVANVLLNLDETMMKP
ncbi:MAG: DUF1553 domain-containing protein [Pirellulaceae bacterium]